MEKKRNRTKWIVVFFILVSLIITLFGGVIYIVDPCFQYRVRDNSYLLNPIYNGQGLIKNYDYDTLIIGSSMTQNFDMDTFREELGAQPLHIGIGGMNTKETEELLELGRKTGKAKEYYVCIDLSNFAKEEGSHFPSYLGTPSLRGRLQYIVSHESWFYLMPVDIGLSLLKTKGYSFNERYKERMSVDRLGDWSLGCDFGKDVVLENYKENRFQVSDVDTDNLRERMKSNMDQFIEEIGTSKGDCHFFLPPYSTLYWCDAWTDGYFQDFLEAKKYFIQKLMAYGYDVYDFQAEELTMNLDHYKDTTHYGPDINDWMVRCFAAKKCLMTEENYRLYQDRLEKNTRDSRKKYRDIL